MKQIDEMLLETSLPDRVAYFTEFVGFNEQDVEAVHGAAAWLAPLVPSLVDAVYDKLFSYSSTKRHFVPRQSGYSGEAPRSIEELQLDHAAIQFRKEHLGRYLAALVTRPYDGKFLHYLDTVGKIHTPAAGSKELHVPLVQMNALLAWVSDAVIATILAQKLPREVEVKTLRAFNKVLWIQNDLIARHYQDRAMAVAAIEGAMNHA